MTGIDFFNECIVICKNVSVIGAAVGVLYSLYAKAKKPQEDMEKRIEAIESDIKDIKTKLDNDYSKINQNRDDTQLLMRSMFNLIENKITGNNVEGLKKTRDELIQALTEK